MGAIRQTKSEINSVSGTSHLGIHSIALCPQEFTNLHLKIRIKRILRRDNEGISQCLFAMLCEIQLGIKKIRPPGLCLLQIDVCVMDGRY